MLRRLQLATASLERDQSPGDRVQPRGVDHQVPDPAPRRVGTDPVRRAENQAGNPLGEVERGAQRDTATQREADNDDAVDPLDV
jgi:hypothetical protein